MISKELKDRFSYVNQKNIDWHVHTTASDGRLTPSKIVKEAKRSGLKEIAITDHDAVSGIKEAQKAGKKLGVTIIPGVELTCYDGDIEVHIKGLNIDPTNPGILKLCKMAAECRDERAKIIVQKLNRLGYNVSWERVLKLKTDVIGRGQIIRAFMENEDNLKKLQATYHIKHQPDGKDVINYLISEGKPAYAKKAPLTVVEAIKAINNAGGIVELSHPGGEKNITPEFSEKKIREYKKKGLEALEVYYGDHTLKQIKKYAKIAKKLNLIATGGTDFHAIPENKRKIGLGKNNLSRFWKKS